MEAMRRSMVLLLLLLPISLVARADDCACAPKPPPGPTTWAGNFQGGYTRSAGTTVTSTGNLKFELDYTALPWANELTGSAVSGRSNGATTAEQYQLGDKEKFSFNDVDYVFGDAIYDDDRFSGIQQNYSETVGYGRRLLMLEHQTLDAEVGAGVSQQQQQGGSSFQTQFIATFGDTYVYTFSPTSKFSQTLRTEVGTQNTLIDPVAALTMNIIGHVNATLNYELQYNTTVPANTRHTDSITSLNLGYTFGKSS